MGEDKPSVHYKSNTGYPLLGQPWVFFSCHPDSFAQVMDHVQQDVLSCCDCVFCWHDPTEAAAIDLDDLAQVALFVFAVDRRFIDVDCPANTTLWRYAIEHHIPILPLLMEDGLVVDFNERFGELHTLLGYGSARLERLKAYFDRLFVAESMAHEIREAFDAYVFLSYRKVDAAEAAELIKSIRSLDFCRDVAIWFDAYLAPGEDFNVKIREALHRSDLFALLVTPSLVVEKNYVSRVEYPEAKRGNCDILPIEMRPTDSETLADWYKDIPSRIDGTVPSELAAALHEHLGDAASGTNDEGRHVYCIGLAYLQGIDVEVNKGQAAVMIGKAADGGVQDAMRTLSAMYEEGNGVRRDYGEAALWCEKLARSLQPSIDLQSTDDLQPADWLPYVDALVEAANRYGELRQVDHALELLEEGADYLGPETVGSDATLTVCRAKVACATGSLQLMQGKTEQALDSYRRAIFSFERTPEEARDGRLLCAWADALRRKANLVFQREQRIMGRVLTESALSLYEEAYAQDHSYEAGFGCAFCHQQLCTYELDDNHQQAAAEQLRACGDLLRDVKSRHGEGRTLDELFEWHMLTGDMATVANDYDTALDAYRQAERIVLHMRKDDKTILSSKYLLQAYAALGNTHLELDQYDEAARTFLPGYVAARQLADEVGDLQSKVDLELFCTKLGLIERERGNLDEAETYICKEVELSREIDRVASTVDTRFSLGLALCQLGLLRRAQKKAKPMNEAFREAYALFDRVDDETGGASWANEALQDCLRVWDESSHEVKSPKEQRAQRRRERAASRKNKKASDAVHDIVLVTAILGMASHFLPFVPDYLMGAAAVLAVGELVSVLVFSGDNLLPLYLVGAAVGAGLGKLFGGDPRSGAAVGACVIAIAMNGLALYARIIYARAKRSGW